MVLHTIDRGLARAEYAVTVVLISALTLIMVAQVILRYVFSSPIFWAEDVAVQILTLVVLIGISGLIYRKDMIRVDALTAFLPEKGARPLERLMNLAGLVTLMVLCIYAAGWLMRPETRFNITATTGLLRWYNHSAMALCFVCMTFHLLVKLIAPHPAEDQAAAVEEA